MLTLTRRVLRVISAGLRGAPWCAPLVATVVLACLAIGCGHRDSAEPSLDVTERVAALSTTSQLISLPFPLGVSRDSVGLGANGSLLLDDRAAIQSTNGTPGAVSNAGSTATNVGVGTASGTLTSLASVLLRGSHISGPLTTVGTLTSQNGSTVSGTVTQHATLTPLNVFSWTVLVPQQNAGDVTLSPGSSGSVSPGAYGNITAFAGAQLHLTAGTYYATSLDVEPQAQLILDTSAGPVIIYVTGGVIYRGQVVNAAGPSSDFLLGCLGSSAVSLGAPFTGTVVTPNASLTLTSAATPYQGTFYAHDIEVQPGTTVVALPFNWTRLFPPSPVAGLPNDPVNPPKLPPGPFGTKLTPTTFPRVLPPTPYSGNLPLFGAGSAHAGSGSPDPLPQGVLSWGDVDNIGWGYIHEAVDYITPEGAPTPDQSNKMTSLALRRYYKPRFTGIVSTFGPGMFSSFDSKLRIVSNGSGGFNILTFQMSNDLGEVQWTETSSAAGDNQVDGVYHTNAGVGQTLTLLTSAGATTPSPTAAATAVLTDLTGNQTVFELINAGTPDVRSGRLSKLVDMNGNAETVAYKFAANASSSQLGGDQTKLWQMASVTDNYGLVGTFDYAAAKVLNLWVVSAFHAPNSTTLTYTYNAGQVIGGSVGPALSQVAFPDGSTATFSTAVESATNLVIVHVNDRAAGPGLMVKDIYLSQAQMRKADGTLVNQQTNLVRQVVNGAGEVMYANWDDPAVAGTTYVYEGGGALTRIELANGSVPTSFARANFFDPALPPNQAKFDPVETYQADTFGRLISKADAAGRTTSWTRDPVTTAVTALQFADGSRQTRVFGAFLRLSSFVDRNGNTNQYTFDAKGNLSKAIAAVGQAISGATSVQVNSRGQTTQSTDARGNSTTYAYDSRGFLLSITEAADVQGGARAVTSYEYDGFGRMTAMTSPDGQRKTFTYDSRNRLVKTTYPDGSTEVQTYGSGSTAGLVVNMTDRNGNVSNMSYDLATRLAKTTEGVGTSAQIVNLKTYLSGTLHEASDTKGGEETDLNYDSKNRVVATTVHTVGSRTLVNRATYDSLSRTTSMTDSYGRRQFLYYDTNNNLTHIVQELVIGGVTGDPASLTRVLTADPAYAIEDHVFSTVGDEVVTVDPVGTITANGYDSLRRLTQKIQALGTSAQAVWQYAYDAVGNMTTMKRPRSFSEGANSVTAYTYTGRNLVASVTTAPGSTEQATVQIAYTPSRKKAQITDARGGITRYTYSTCCDRLETVTDPTGAKTTYAYDANGNRISLTDPNSNVERSTYDALNRPLTVINGAGETTTYAYDDNLTDGVGIDAHVDLRGIGFGVGADGSAVERTDALGGTRYMVHDGLGRTVLEQDENGHISRYAYDAIVGTLVESTRIDPLSNVIRTRTDSVGKARAIIDAEGNMAIQAFDAAGRQLLAADATGVGTECTFDPLGREISCTDTSGVQSSRAYDTEGNIIATVDGQGDISKCAFDAVNRRTTCTDRLGLPRSFSYDAASNVAALTDAEGNVTRFDYDARGLKIAEHYSDGSNISRQFDAGGRLSATTAADGIRISNVYDGANRLVSRNYPDGVSDTFSYDLNSRLTEARSGRYQNTIGRTYDPKGNMLSETSTIAGVARTVTNTYDSANHRTAIGYPDGSVVNMSYSARDLVNTIQSGTRTLASYSYDAAGRVLANALGNGKVESHSYLADGLPSSVSIQGLSSLTFQYNADKKQTAELRNGQPYDAFGYDAEQRLTSWSRSGTTETWELSGEGDFQTVLINGLGSEARNHNSVHEVTAINEGSLTYDARGRLLTDRSGRSFSWGIDGNLLGVVQSPGGEADYTYDALGRRATRKVGATTTAFVYQNAQVLAEYDNGSLARSYVLGLMVDQPIAMRIGSANYYYARQANGSIHAVMGDSGTIVEQYSYDAYGFRTILAPDGSMLNASTIGNPYGFTGRYHDATVGIIDFRARQYSPELGRFISRDSSYANGLSLYAAYFAPDKIDPSGHLSWSDLNPVNVAKGVVSGVEKLGSDIVGAGKSAVDAVGNTLNAVSATVSNAIGDAETAVESSVTALASVGGALAGAVVGTAEQAAAILGGAVEQGINTVMNTTLKGVMFAVDRGIDLGQAIADATVDAATWLAAQTASVANDIANLAVRAAKAVATLDYDIVKWAVYQVYNIGKGALTEAWQLGVRGFGETWNLVKALGYAGWWFISSPYYIIKDPEAWALTGLKDDLDILKEAASMALWVGLDLLPVLSVGENYLNDKTTLFGIAVGIGGWIDGGDAPTLSFAGGGLVVQFGHSPFALSNNGQSYNTTYGRAIVYSGSPDDPDVGSIHEFQHVTQYDVFGDQWYFAAHLTSDAIGSGYGQDTVLEYGPYGQGGPHRPWPWYF